MSLRRRITSASRFPKLKGVTFSPDSSGLGLPPLRAASPPSSGLSGVSRDSEIQQIQMAAGSLSGRKPAVRKARQVPPRRGGDGKEATEWS